MKSKHKDMMINELKNVKTYNAESVKKKQDRLLKLPGRGGN